MVPCLALRSARAPDRRSMPRSPRSRRRLDMAVTALRLAGLTSSWTPDWLGLYARDGAGRRYRRGAVYRQTAIGVTFERPDALRRRPWPTRGAVVAPARLRGRAAPRPRSTTRWRSTGAPTSASRCRRRRGCSCCSLAGGGARPIRRDADDSLARLADNPQADAFAWYAAHGRALRNASRTASGSDAAERSTTSPALLGEVLPALLMAWRAHGKSRPAKTLLAALRDPAATRLAGGRARRGYRSRPEQRYAGLDTALLVERGQTTRRAALVRAGERARRPARRPRCRRAGARRRRPPPPAAHRPRCGQRARRVARGRPRPARARRREPEAARDHLRRGGRTRRRRRR